MRCNLANVQYGMRTYILLNSNFDSKITTLLVFNTSASDYLCSIPSNRMTGAPQKSKAEAFLLLRPDAMMASQSEVGRKWNLNPNVITVVKVVSFSQTSHLSPQVQNQKKKLAFCFPSSLVQSDMKSVSSRIQLFFFQDLKSQSPLA